MGKDRFTEWLLESKAPSQVKHVGHVIAYHMEGGACCLTLVDLMKLTGMNDISDILHAIVYLTDEFNLQVELQGSDGLVFVLPRGGENE